MNIAIIFAGGVGRRMNLISKPKQFLELKGKPIIIYTLEVFDNSPSVDAIIVVCVESWMTYLKKQIQKFGITKVSAVVEGGNTGQESIFNGLKKASELYPPQSIVLIHDGVRPLINEKTVEANIDMTIEKGNCITCVPAIETFIVKQSDGSLLIPDRNNSLIARAPQTFVLKDIFQAHIKAIDEGKMDFIDSCTMMSYYGHKMNTIIGPMENIKITTPTDFFIFRTMVEVHETQQIFGL